VRECLSWWENGWHGRTIVSIAPEARMSAAATAVAVFRRAALVLVVLGAAPAVHAESLRCNGASAAEGDSKLSVLYKCGQPLLADAFCAPVYVVGSPYPLPPPLAAVAVPCQPVEEWLYDRGPGNLLATVRFRDGKVLSIRYGQLPR
jgi:hypothetical protein